MDSEACHAAVQRGHKELDTTEQLNWTDSISMHFDYITV